MSITVKENQKCWPVFCLITAFIKALFWVIGWRIDVCPLDETLPLLHVSDIFIQKMQIWTWHMLLNLQSRFFIICRNSSNDRSVTALLCFHFAPLFLHFPLHTVSTVLAREQLSAGLKEGDGSRLSVRAAEISGCCGPEQQLAPDVWPVLQCTVRPEEDPSSLSPPCSLSGLWKCFPNYYVPKTQTKTNLK